MAISKVYFNYCNSVASVCQSDDIRINTRTCDFRHVYRWRVIIAFMAVTTVGCTVNFSDQIIRAEMITHFV